MWADLIPILFILLLGAGVLWILWRVIRRLLRAPATRPDPALGPHPEGDERRREPALRTAAVPPAPIPDAADVLALKAAIDNLARQVAALERRLASGPINHPAPPPSPPLRIVERAPAPSEAPPVTPDRRS